MNLSLCVRPPSAEVWPFAVWGAVNTAAANVRQQVCVLEGTLLAPGQVAPSGTGRCSNQSVYLFLEPPGFSQSGGTMLPSHQPCVRPKLLHMLSVGKLLNEEIPRGRTFVLLRRVSGWPAGPHPAPGSPAPSLSLSFISAHPLSLDASWVGMSQPWVLVVGEDLSLQWVSLLIHLSTIAVY